MPSSVLTARMRLGALHFNRGDLAQSKRQFERCLELAREQGRLRHQAWVTAFLGLLIQSTAARGSEADELFGLACEWIERTNDRYMLVQTLMWRGAPRADAGRHQCCAQAPARSRAARQRLRRCARGERVPSPRRGARTARPRRRGERVAEAARSEAPDEDAFAQAAVWVAEAFAAHASGDDADARRHFAQALPILEKQGARSTSATHALGFARLLEAAGDIMPQPDQLERAREPLRPRGRVRRAWPRSIRGSRACATSRCPRPVARSRSPRSPEAVPVKGRISASCATDTPSDAVPLVHRPGRESSRARARDRAQVEEDPLVGADRAVEPDGVVEARTHEPLPLRLAGDGHPRRRHDAHVRREREHARVDRRVVREVARPS